MRQIFWVIFLFYFISCDSLKEKPKGRIIAKVKDQHLYEAELQEVIPADASEEDSIFIRENYIATWVKAQLIYMKAVENLSSEQLNKDKELKEYYRSLVRYDYERMFLGKKLDSIVTDEEVNSYYNENQKNFELKRNIIRFLYIKLNFDAPDFDKVRLWMQNVGVNDLKMLKKYADENAVNFSLDTTYWYYFDDIKKEVPIIEAHDPEHFIRNNNYVELRDASYLYLINILDNRIRDEISPLALEKEKIKQIILNKRQVRLIQDMENNIYREGMEQNLFEIYN